MMKLTNVLQYAHDLMEQTVSEGSAVVDATAGNGHDTLFLSELVGDSGKVYAFDVQEQAIENTREKLAEAGRENVTLILDGHENVQVYVNEKIDGAIFNLGFLPGSDKSIVTTGRATWQAIQGLLELLKVGGLIVLVIYHGHDGGKLEKSFIEAQLLTLDKKKTAIIKYEFLNRDAAPYVIAIEKLKE